MRRWTLNSSLFSLVTAKIAWWFEALGDKNFSYFSVLLYKEKNVINVQNFVFQIPNALLQKFISKLIKFFCNVDMATLVAQYVVCAVGNAHVCAFQISNPDLYFWFQNIFFEFENLIWFKWFYFESSRWCCNFLP